MPKIKEVIVRHEYHGQVWYTPVDWTPEKLKEWVKERAEGVQYTTEYGVVLCPPRKWEKPKS